MTPISPDIHPQRRLSATLEFLDYLNSGSKCIELFQTMRQYEIDLNALKSLVLVVNAGGFSALLQRTTRGLSLTSAGSAVVDGAEPALAQIEAL